MLKNNGGKLRFGPMFCFFLVLTLSVGIFCFKAYCELVLRELTNHLYLSSFSVSKSRVADFSFMLLSLEITKTQSPMTTFYLSLLRSILNWVFLTRLLTVFILKLLPVFLITSGIEVKGSQC
jgi:hypothetical protein